MTKEEKELTITYLTKMQEEYIEGEGYERHPLPEYFALDLAIKALEQEPSEDCVSRAEMLKYQQYLYGKMPNDENQKLWEFIKELPPVTPTRKKGEWCKQNDDYFDWYECSECGYGSEGEMQYSSECDVRTKYCPNCGAKMI